MIEIMVGSDGGGGGNLVALIALIADLKRLKVSLCLIHVITFHPPFCCVTVTIDYLNYARQPVHLK